MHTWKNEYHIVYLFELNMIRDMIKNMINNNMIKNIIYKHK